ncbi:unnamed protein product [Rotaria magnacalcarata]|uniref:Mitochondria-eating protein n=1 Tax=Rotaria magnacalcarata TaxID=392030 RepID=A0A816RUV3_9BILA|nr:unnamed protein product [Rotaria magnacalcarata]
MAAKVFLRRLNDMSTFNLLQDKLSRLNDTYLSNSCDTNVSRCIDVIELNARVQRELFKLLNLVSAEGNLSELELDLRHANVDNARLEAELEQTRAELIDERYKATDEKIFTETELANLRSRLSDAEFRLSLERYKPRSAVVDDYEREIRRLRDDIEFAQTRSRARSLSPVHSYVRRRSLSPARSLISLSSSSDESLQKLRENTLIQRFNDLYARERLDAMDILRSVSDDYEMNQRICFNIIQESFSVSKRRFVEWKLRLRSQLAITVRGSDSLEDVVQDYINRNLDYFEVTNIVSEVIDNLHRNPRISLPLGVTYSLVSTYIREACRIAWHMACLVYPLDIAFASDAEVFDETKYRRSYDSEYSAPLVNHHIWPALMQGSRVIVKGEACTKRGASLSRSRASSPIRRGYSSPIRSRSVSPVRRSRATSPILYSSLYRYY